MPLVVDGLDCITPDLQKSLREIQRETADNPRSVIEHVLQIAGEIAPHMAIAVAEVQQKALRHKARKRRESKYRALHFLRSHSTQRRIRACKWARIDATKGVEISVKGGVSHYGNLQSCASVHACPVCGPKIREQRAEEIARGLAVHRAMGGGVEFVTLTIRHTEWDRLGELLKLVRTGWSHHVMDGRAWRADRQDLGVVGTIRTLEVNYGANGWHPHLHVLVLTERPLAEHERQYLGDTMFHRWAGYMAQCGKRPPTREHGLQIVSVVSDADVSRYMSKVYDNVHHEMTRGDLKAGHGRNPFQVLADVVATGDVADLDVWREYEKAIKGQRFLAWSKGLKARLMVEETTDEDLVDAEVGGELVAVIGFWTWRQVRRNPRFMRELLDAAEDYGEQGVYELLDTLDFPDRPS